MIVTPQIYLGGSCVYSYYIYMFPLANSGIVLGSSHLGSNQAINLQETGFV